MRELAVCIVASAMLISSSAQAAPQSLDADAVAGAQSFFAELAEDIKAAVAKAEGGRQRLLARARVPEDLGREIDALSKLAREAAGMTGIRFNTFTLSATTWFGILPLKQIDYHFIVVPDRIRLLRSVVRDASMRPFSRVRSLGWSGPAAEAFRTIGSQVTRMMTEGACRALPRIGAVDHPALLPKKHKSRQNTLAVFKRFRKSILRDCKALTSLPHHRTTVRLGELRGSVKTEGARNVPFRVTITYAEDGSLQLFHLQGSAPKER